jgi:hypothetical protein
MNKDRLRIRDFVFLVLGGVIVLGSLGDLLGVNLNFSHKKTGEKNSNYVEEEKPQKERTILDAVLYDDYTLNGNGSVTFSPGFKSEEGEVFITGAGYTLTGQYRIESSFSMRIFDLLVTSGMFDASNNSESYGTFYLESDGDIGGTLYGGSDERRIRFTRKEY